MSATEEFWEDFYRDGRGAWSGKPNALLVDAVADLAPGTALDLGCGEGGDAIWLASRGWQVTAADIASAALALAAERATAAGVAEVIEWQRHDLAVSSPPGSFDLVTACFLHSPVPLPRDQILRSAAAAVAPGGTLLVVGHAGPPSWARHDHGIDFPTPQEVLDGLALPAARWALRRSDVVTRQVLGPDREPGTRTDNVLRVERLRG
ncbi:MAG: methyltransferase domain-containing protein [Actinomycetota bacterium]|nr:methyltransferase domain-containing protein [Actinomycetota bacterium]